MKKYDFYLVLTIALLIVNTIGICVTHNSVNELHKEIIKLHASSIAEANKDYNKQESNNQIIVKDTTDIIYDRNDKYSCLYLKDIDDILKSGDRLKVYYEKNNNIEDITINVSDSTMLINFTNNRIHITTKEKEEYDIVEADDYVQDSDIRTLNLITTDDIKRTIYIIDRIKYEEKDSKGE